MNLMTRTRADLATGRIDIARLRLAIDLASRTVAPLWPLDGAIAVNPLAGFETLPFDEAVRAAATRFDARPGLSLELWRQLSARGTPSRDAVRDAAMREPASTRAPDSCHIDTSRDRNAALARIP